MRCPEKWSRGYALEETYLMTFSCGLWLRTSGGGPICRSPHSRLAEPMNGGKQGVVGWAVDGR